MEIETVDMEAQVSEMEIEMADMEAQATVIENESTTIFNKVSRPVTLMFKDVVYKIKIEERGLLKKSPISEEKIILKGITGIVLPGEILALLGPSGSGKTTLLTSLGGRLGGLISGSVTYNGKPFSNTLKRNIGFITQDDFHHPHLTVTETLVYTALLRLPRTLSKEEKVQHVDAVVTQLGLSRCRNTIVGGPQLRGISGGERKRVSIGQEMLIDPSLLFLDEPTSGLDSTTAMRIVSTLSELANGGRTIVMTIHQPSSRLFYKFHKILLLSEGNPLYYGKGSSALDYFSDIGFAPSVVMNPADFLLDLANGVLLADSHDDQNDIKQTLIHAYENNLCEKVKAGLFIIDDQVPESIEDCQFEQMQNTWLYQFSILFSRVLKERKHQSFSGLKIAQVLVIAFLCGSLWWKSDISNIQDQVGLFFFYTSFWGAYPLFQAIFTFPQEQIMLAKERSSGMYRLSSYFMAQTMGDMPIELVLPTIFFFITYWMAGLKPTAGSFLSGLFILLYSVLCVQGLGLAIGAMAMDQKSAMTLGSVIILIFLLASGFFVQHVPRSIGWIKYLSISYHTLKLLLGSQHKLGETYPCSMNKSCSFEDIPSVKAVGLDGQAVSVIALAIMLVGYRLIAYLALTRIGAPKK